MITQLSPALRQELQPLYERWPVFVEKLRARASAIIEEAKVGLGPLIEQHAADYGPMGAAFTALQTRFDGLQTKLEEAGSKIEEALWEVMFRDGIGEQDGRVLSAIHTDFCRQQRQQDDELRALYDTLNTETKAQWARKVYEVARGEMASEVACSQCGANVPRRIFWQASNETCSHCQAINSVKPGHATYAFYAGGGIEALCHEQGFADWRAEQEAKRVLDAYRFPTAYDHWQYMQAAGQYWTKYYEAWRQMHPGFAQSHGSVEQAVAAKLKHYTAHDSAQDTSQREFVGQLLEVAYSGNAAQFTQLFHQKPEIVDLDDAAYSAMERHQPAAAQLILNVKYDVEGEDEPREAWLREQMRELTEYVRSN